MNDARIDTRRGGTGRAFTAVTIGASLLAGCASLPDDGKAAKTMRFDGLRAMRYCEVFLIGDDAVTKDLKADFYNTTDLNKAADPRDTCPADLWAKVDPETLKKQYKALDVFKNGPRHWATDWIELPVGTQRDFGGLQARWMGLVQLPKGVDLRNKGSSAYKPTIVSRKSQMGFVKGKPFFMLVSPDGMPWVMQDYSNIVDPNLTYDHLKTLGERLKLPTGWKYRVAVLERDLTVRAVNGNARIVQDDLENTYDACFAVGSAQACSLTP